MPNPLAKSMSSFHVGIAAEAFAAGLFARCGCDVSIQYGANQPEYDLAVIRGEQMLKVSVKGSQDGSWGLTQSFMKKGTADYHGAIDLWRKQHRPRTVFCLVQFKGIGLLDMPRVYIATPEEIASTMKLSRGGKGNTILQERKTWGSRAYAAGTLDEIPDQWRLSMASLERVMASA